MLIIDTETSGDKGIPIWHPQNRLLQIGIEDDVSGDIFEFYIKYEESFFVTPENTKLHNITNLTLESQGVSLKVVMEKMLAWVPAHSKGRPRLLAHNATFDRNVIRIALYRGLGLDFGPGAKELGWDFVCSLDAARDLLKEPDLELFPKEKPYSLGSLYSFYFNENPDGLHNATRDVKALRRLYNEIIVPRMTNEDKYLVGGPVKRGRLTLVNTISGFKEGRTIRLSNAINDAFRREGNSSGTFDFSKFAQPPALLTLGHLVLYGQLRYMQKLRQKQAEGEKITAKDQCLWFEIAKSIECLLRRELEIYSDALIGELVAKVCNRDIVDLTLHTAREDGTLDFFPTMKGEPISYLPLRISAREATSLYETRGWGTINEIIAAWLTTEQSGKANFYREVNGCFYRTNPSLEAIFKDTLAKF